ncbi:hypothetical protein QBC46DRAFT_387123 [Diplogelasinospora grovesii]|uniref:Sexual development protein n=1 Tax=Diplogelasinospora grovesii TaxID=303347 RepID=A0AAN6N9I8_9PEZI|nr:hypothetical protein QBC46DRAFT_387123 [Diplogelasinospora grovesii]
MRLVTAAALCSAAAFAGFSAAAPLIPRYDSPAAMGYPNPNDAQLKAIQNLADGTLSNAPPPPKLEPSSLTAFQLIAFNEEFEVAFFSSLIENITNSVPGFDLPSQEKKDELLDILETVLAQEELHAINAIKVLEHFNAFAPMPCQYRFPTTNVYDAIALAETFTAVVLGTLQDAAQLLATNGDAGPVRAVASVIGQEGEQEGFYRILLAKKPSEKPFLTTSTAPFAFSALQAFVVPGSCPFPLSKIDLPIFQPLAVLTGRDGADVGPSDQTLTFSANLTGVQPAKTYVGGNGNGLYITYLTGQNLPISEAITNVRWNGDTITFDAFFPFTANVMQGLSIAALTTGSNFATADDIPAATLAAPGLIQVNDKVKAWDAI